GSHSTPFIMISSPSLSFWLPSLPSAYALSLHDALPIWLRGAAAGLVLVGTFIVGGPVGPTVDRAVQLVIHARDHEVLQRRGRHRTGKRKTECGEECHHDDEADTQRDIRQEGHRALERTELVAQKGGGCLGRVRAWRTSGIRCPGAGAVVILMEGIHRPGNLGAWLTQHVTLAADGVDQSGLLRVDLPAKVR